MVLITTGSQFAQALAQYQPGKDSMVVRPLSPARGRERSRRLIECREGLDLEPGSDNDWLPVGAGAGAVPAVDGFDCGSAVGFGSGEEVVDGLDPGRNCRKRFQMA